MAVEKAEAFITVTTRDDRVKHRAEQGASYHVDDEGYLHVETAEVKAVYHPASWQSAVLDKPPFRRQDPPATDGLRAYHGTDAA